MDFERTCSPGATLWAVPMFLVACAIAGVPVYCAISRFDIGPILVASLCCLPLAGLLLLGTWTMCLSHKVELSSSPRVARCWRKNELTKRSSQHTYSIRDDARVVLGRRHGGSYGSEVFYSVKITGLPWFCNFYLLGHGRNIDDALGLGCALALFLDLCFVDYRGKDYPVDSPDMPKWHGPRPDPEDSAQHRRRRRHRRP